MQRFDKKINERREGLGEREKEGEVGGGEIRDKKNPNLFD